MKRRPSLPLFRAIEPDVYIIDTSAWLNIDLRSDSEAVWSLVVDLIAQDRIVTCAPVIQELHEDPIYMLRIKPYEKALLAGDKNSDDPTYLLHVGKVTFDHPGMCHATGRKSPADPYVVALAELEGYVVVADENANKRPNRKIPGVCKHRRIRCLTLEEFVAAARKR